MAVVDLLGSDFVLRDQAYVADVAGQGAPSYPFAKALGYLTHHAWGHLCSWGSVAGLALS